MRIIPRLLAVVLTLSMLFIQITHGAEPKDNGVRWGGRVVSVDGDKVTVRLLMITASCGNAGPQHGKANQEIKLTAVPGQTYKQGQDTEFWMGDEGPTFKMPACLEW